jgi:hypothetical protein
MTAPEPRESKPARHGVRPLDLALILWPSFLAAGVASVVFFGAVDPLLLRDAGPKIFDNLDREAGYALGFLFFWAVSIVASALSVYLIRTAEPKGQPADADHPKR